MPAQPEQDVWMRQGMVPTLRQQIQLIAKLSIPAILAEISSIAMQYIDAAMVGSLGGCATAAIGLVASTTWLFGGLCVSAAAGFSVQVAHLTGAGKFREARDVLRQALIAALVFGTLLSAVGVVISERLPIWLHGDIEIRADASSYFFIYACALPAAQLRQTSGAILQCSGDLRTPSFLNILMCGLDVVLNALLIFPARALLGFRLPGAGLGVAGAALGTALAEGITAVLMLCALCFRSSRLRLEKGGAWHPNRRCLGTAVRLALPMALEHVVLCGAQITTTRIVAPLGTVAVAANSLAVTAESLCYMPGHGIGVAATTLVGQSIGANRRDMTKQFARLTVLIGAVVMTCAGGLMFVLAPAMFALLTPDLGIRALGVQVLRVEAFAEPLFAVSIVTAGALRGAGDTLVPSILNLVSMWGIRITLSLLLAPKLGLMGVWLAMCGELCARGILFLMRLLRGRWLSHNTVFDNSNQK